MIDGTKAVFLPVNEKILNLYKGYILNGEVLANVKKSDLCIETKYYEYSDNMSKTEQIIRIIVLTPFLPILILILAIASILNKFEPVKDKISYWIDSFLGILFKREQELQINTTMNKKYKDATEEDVPKFFDHCKMCSFIVHLYSYHPLTKEQQLKVDKLIQSGIISSFHNISKLSDLIQLLNSANISISNSLLVITSSNEKHEANILGFHSGNGNMRNVKLWAKRNFNGEGELEWNSHETLIDMRREITPLLKAKNKTFFTEDAILFIEDKWDEFLNNYIKRNLITINKKLSEKKCT